MRSAITTGDQQQPISAEQNLCYNLERETGFVAFMKYYVQFLLFRYHIVFQLPPCASAELSDDNIAITKQINVKFDVGARLNVGMSTECNTASNS